MKAVAAFLLVLCCLAANVAAWKCRAGPRLYYAQQIDAGQGQVVARDRNYYMYFLIGSAWYRLSTIRFRHVTVGTAGLWASGTNGRVYKYVAGNFVQSIGTTMLQVDAGGDEELVGVSTSYYGSCLRSGAAVSYWGRGSLRWNSLSTRMRYISCSLRNGCWGIDTSYRIYYTQAINPANCRTSRWILVPGQLTMIEVGTGGVVFGVNRSGHLFQRAGISRSRPYGVRWIRIPVCTTVRHVSYDLGRLWVVTTSGTIQLCSH